MGAAWWLRRVGVVLPMLGLALSVATAQTPPAITVQPKVAPPATNITVSGSGFAGSETVDIFLDQTELQTAQSDTSGVLAPVVLALPAATRPGVHTISGVGELSGSRAGKAITVRTDWPLGGFSLQRTHDNPYENILNAGNAPSLVPLWAGATGSWIRSSPVVVGGIVYVGSADFSLYAFRAATGARLWSAPTGGWVVSSPAVANGVVYAGSYDNNVYAFNAATGAKLWSAPTGGTVASSPLVANGLVYIASADNTLYAFVATTGALAWSAPLGVPPDGSGLNGPTLSNGEVLSPVGNNGSATLGTNTVYVGSGDHNLYAFNAHTGAKRWAAPTGDWVDSTPCVANGLVYVGSWDMNFYAFNATTGAKVWATPLNGVIVSSPAIANGVVYIGSGDHNLYALDAMTGATLWTAPTGDVVGSSPAVANGVVYVGSFDSKVYAFDAATGARLWSFLLPFYVESSPAVVNGVMYVGAMAGKKPLFAFTVKAPSPAPASAGLGPLAR